LTLIHRVNDQTLTFAVAPSRLWSGAVVLIALTAASVLWAWAALQVLWPDAGRFAIVVLACTALGLGVSLARVRSVVLRWDGQVWHFSHVANADVFNPGALTVSLDLGSWMLVRWQSHQEMNATHKTIAAWAGREWIPVQRNRLQGNWHAWRCAVFGRVT
jgi:hypothetical protein